MDDEDWKQLSIPDKISHKAWKARLQGYDELGKNILMMDLNEIERYCDIVRKAPLESNAAALDKALECVLHFLQNAPELSSRVAADCTSAIGLKVMTARPKSKQLGFDVCLQLVENELGNIVVEELLKVVTNKSPKVVIGSTELLLITLKEFGGKIIDIKPIIKATPKLLAHSDKSVRNNAKAIVIECYYYIGDPIKNIISDIQPVQMKELEEEFSKIKNKPPPIPPRKIRSQIGIQTQVNDEIVTCDDGMDAKDELIAVDPYDLLDPVDVISLVPNDFFTKIVTIILKAKRVHRV